MDTFIRKAEIVRVIDGDSIVLDVDLGYSVWTRATFRLAGINAPELRGADRTAGIAATVFLTNLLEDGLREGKELYVLSTKTGKYGRWLGMLYLTGESDDAVNVNHEMIKMGHAVPYP